MSPLPRSTPAAAGVNPEGIADFIRAVEKQPGGVHSFMLLRHGKVVAETSWYPYTAERPHLLYSLSKSFTSTAIGLAVHEGRLTVEDQLISFFPEKLPEFVSDRLAAMRIKDLLTMNTGHATEPSRQGDDWVKNFLTEPVEHEPGTFFLYNTAATNTLTAVLKKVTGQDLLEYLEPRLFMPLGIYGVTCSRGPDGIQMGGSGMSARIEDLAKFGQLYLQNGQWEGREIVPAAWVEEATSRQVSNGDPNQPNDWTQGYGYQFWRTRNGFYRGDGAFGQYCLVMPALDAVLVVNSGIGDMGQILEQVWKHLVPAFDEENPAAESLEVLTGTRVLPGPDGAPSSQLSKVHPSLTWPMAPNAEQVKSITLRFEPDYCFVEKKGGGSPQGSTAGFAHWHLHDHDEIGATRASRYAWEDEHTLTVWTWELNGPYRFSETYRIEGSRLRITNRGYNVRFGPTELPDLESLI